MNHDDDTCPNLVPANRQYHQALSANRKLLAENARLKAEVERLTAFTTRTIIPNEELQAQVERLTKAGDYLACHISIVSGNRHFDARDEWLRAKKGFPSIQEQWKIEERNRTAAEAAKEGKQP